MAKKAKPQAAAPPQPSQRVRHARPLSPHIQIYRWTLPMALSILHRASGMALYGGMALFVGFLWLLADGGGAYRLADGWLRSPLGEWLLVLFVWALLHHLCGGLRHFVWDLGYGYGPRATSWLSWLSALLPIAGAALLWAEA